MCIRDRSKAEYEQFKKLKNLLSDESFCQKINELYHLVNGNANVYAGEVITDLQTAASHLFDKEDTIWDEL